VSDLLTNATTYGDKGDPALEYIADMALQHWVATQATPAPKPMVGLFSTLTDEQKVAALDMPDTPMGRPPTPSVSEAAKVLLSDADAVTYLQLEFSAVRTTVENILFGLSAAGDMVSVETLLRDRAKEGK